ncbi:MAG: hypothetical protein OER80_01605 [Gammaproteobacteria bacterium]|nr:hypothetical protein [Gammaproteobacteria bacterium]MDH3768815.1 hypothetical protein [Gammaproteobacteria bacterium]
MNIRSMTVFAVLIITLAAGCWHDTTGSGKKTATAAKQHQATLECPTDLEQYCGGWDVHSTNIVPANEHITQHENFVIGKKNSGANQTLALFPRGNLLMRWNSSRVDLKEIPSTGTPECLVGRVQIGTHSGGHNWHGITLRVDTKTVTPEIGVEDELIMCLTVQQGGAWPTACAPTTCEYELLDGEVDPRSHGGRAHSYD